ncbi:type II toxin-antitoxin system RelE/ParE family toxin [Marinobacter sp. ATCH36]|uniref:type II toxin-antitoxin system RelE/ParE family toxin n=1 Tax=Marinobacter sp. ATCH36 TaxID=2945106 RepID=UPI002021A406|nr:type II toxin-antitoxin system RelE/ParE family toxin [Marinobacter sp. ATCH36]MCL7945168.1 type II toxin-antitoxin system RelE/ParE family toxin [Marinobacter sp. ATCH36]
MEYVLSRKAEEDVIGIFLDGIEKFGLAQSDEYHSKLKECFEFLAANPLAAAERKEFRPVVRIHPVGVHLVIYRQETYQRILIIRVRHSREDWLP